MIINFTNKIEIDNYYVHDSIIEEYMYNYEKKEIKMTILNYNQKIKHTFIFKEVYYCEIIGIDSWGKSLDILDWELIENDSKINELNKIYDKYNEKNCFDGSQISSKFNLASGDIIKIIFKEVELLNEPM